MTIYNEGWDLNPLKRLLQSKKDKTKQQPRKIEIKNPSKGLTSLGGGYYVYDEYATIAREMESYKYTPREKADADLKKMLYGMDMSPPFPTSWLTTAVAPGVGKVTTPKKPKVKQPKLGKWDVKLDK